MALHLMRAGHSLGVFARRPDALDTILAAGAKNFASPHELAAHCDVVFTMVTATGDVEQVLFGDAGVASGGHPGLLVIDMSTIAPLAAKDFASRLEMMGIAMLDAPVSGGPDGARQATLTIMVGGTEEAFERARPLFECLGKTILRMGPSGSGQATKACHQLLLLITAEGAAEALTLAQRCGVDPVLAQQVMMTGIASSRVLDRFGSRMAARQFENGIAARLYRKDLQIVLDLARTVGVELPAGAVTMEHIARIVARGRENEDLSVLITEVEARSPAVQKA